MELHEVKGKVDFAIITMREDELRAVLDRFPGEAVESQNRFYRISRVPVRDGSTAVVAVARAFEQGTGESQTVARHIIDDLEPHWILLVGIAGGVPDFEHTLGDVVLSTRVNDLTVEAAGVFRATRSGGREYPFLSIRGLSDIVGFKRHPDWTAYACHSAAAFTLALVRSGLVKRKGGTAAHP